jgi:hypothetical protein
MIFETWTGDCPPRNGSVSRIWRCQVVSMDHCDFHSKVCIFNFLIREKITVHMYPSRSPPTIESLRAVLHAVDGYDEWIQHKDDSMLLHHLLQGAVDTQDILHSHLTSAKSLAPCYIEHFPRCLHLDLVVRAHTCLNVEQLQRLNDLGVNGAALASEILVRTTLPC